MRLIHLLATITSLFAVLLLKVESAGELEFRNYYRMIQLPLKSQYDLTKFCDLTSPQFACELIVCAREFRWTSLINNNENNSNEKSDEVSCSYGFSSTNFAFDKRLNLGAYMAPIAAGENSILLNFQNPWQGSAIFDVQIRRKFNGKIIFSRTIRQPTWEIGDNWRQFHANFSSTEFGASVELKMQFRAKCAPNYYGRQCRINCDQDTLNINGSHFECTPEDGSLRCQPGWYGFKCNLTQKCLNVECVRGKCNSDTGRCVCEEGYKGEKCDQCITYLKCQGKCLTRPYECVCPEGRGGILCEKDITYCAMHSPCQNGGICLNRNNGSYTCNCKLGFTGRNCELQIDSCTDSPCQNGAKCYTSFLHPQGFRCECPPGAAGRFCQSTAISCRDLPCENGATCIMKGRSLSLEMTTRSSRYFAFQNDLFKRSSLPFQCLCTQGWSETLCDTPSSWCTAHSCFNGGTCMESLQSTQGFQCRCPMGYAGPRCEWNINDCQDNPCQNNGECIDEINGFQCRCSSGFYGELCQYTNSTKADAVASHQFVEICDKTSTNIFLYVVAAIGFFITVASVLLWNLRTKLNLNIKSFNFVGSSDCSSETTQQQQCKVFSTRSINIPPTIAGSAHEKEFQITPIAVDELMYSTCNSTQLHHFPTHQHHHHYHQRIELTIPPPPYAEIPPMPQILNERNKDNNDSNN